MGVKIIRSFFNIIFWFLTAARSLLLLDYVWYFHKLKANARRFKFTFTFTKFIKFIHILSFYDYIDRILLCILVPGYMLGFILRTVCSFVHNFLYKVVWCLVLAFLSIPSVLVSFFVVNCIFRYPLFIIIRAFTFILDVLIFIIDFVYDLVYYFIILIFKLYDCFRVWYFGFKTAYRIFLITAGNSYSGRFLLNFSIRTLIMRGYLKDKENRDVEVYLNRFFFDLDRHDDALYGKDSFLSRSDRFYFLYELRVQSYLSDVYVAERRRLRVRTKEAKFVHNVYLTRSSSDSFKRLSYIEKYLKEVPQSLILLDYLKRRTFLSRQEYVTWNYHWFSTQDLLLRGELGDNTNAYITSYGFVPSCDEEDEVDLIANNHDLWSDDEGRHNSVLQGGKYERYFTFDRLESRRSFFYGTWFSYISRFSLNRERVNYYMLHDVIDGLRFLLVYLLFLLPRKLDNSLSSFYINVVSPIFVWFRGLRLYLIHKIYSFMSGQSLVHRLLDYDLFSFYLLFRFKFKLLYFWFKGCILCFWYFVSFLLKYFKLVLIELPARILIDMNFYYIWFMLNFLPLVLKVVYSQVRYVVGPAVTVVVKSKVSDFGKYMFKK